MASPAEIVRRWDIRIAREAAASRATKHYANDNQDRPDDYIIVDGDKKMGVWWGPNGPPVPRPASVQRKKA